MRRLTLLLTCALLALPAGTFAQDLPESSPEAIAAHAEGLRAYLAQDYRAAIPHFLRAHELDPTFYVPLFVAALNAGNAGMTATADSLWDVVAENRAHFSDYYQRLIDIYVMRRNGGDWAESMKLARAVASDYPGTKANYNYALWSNSDGRPRAALAALATLDPDKEPMKGWFSYFAVKCNALHFVGDFAGELQCGRDAVQRFPDRGAAHYFIAEALASQGRGPEASAALNKALEHPERLASWSVGAMHGSLGLEMLTHGCGEAIAGEHLAEAVAWYEAMPEVQAVRAVMRRQHAFWLYASGDYKKAYEKLQGINADLGSTWDQGYLAITAGLAGDRAKAQSIRSAFLAGEITRRPEVQQWWAAHISAALDDREGAAAHMQNTWSNLNGHVEPVLFQKMGTHPAYQKFIKPRG